jgi:hypothetical protein
MKLPGEDGAPAIVWRMKKNVTRQQKKVTRLA